MTSALEPATPNPAFASDVRLGLGAKAKSLPPRWFYDDVGSALFEVITLLPEYYLTRTEETILRMHADRIAARLPEGVELVELGSGSSRKTSLMIEAILRRQDKLVYRPIDISKSALDEAARRLRGTHTGLVVEPVAARYRQGLQQIRENGAPKVVLFIGSSIGNFDPAEARKFLVDVREVMSPMDSLLLGTDLEKERFIVEPAYDDPQGVTAAFNLNVLARINRELGGYFDLRRFRHVAEYNVAEHRVEISLESTEAQTVRIEALGLDIAFAKGERIHTENSYKFTRAMIEDLATGAGFHLHESWTDPAEWFALSLLCL